MSAQRAIKVQNKVSDLQSKLSHAAKQSLDRKFGCLYDKLYRKDILEEAWKRVRSNKGAPGVDQEDFECIEEEIGVEEFLTEIGHELKTYTYKPQPVLRCYIDKPGKPEKRPLGIPVIKDRVVQMAMKLVIEPIFEANFLDCSHGFRPERSAKQAVDIIRRKITFDKQLVVVDADIKGYFNNICHRILMNLVRRRISDPHILKLIKSWLESGVMEDGKYIETNGVGTPQGGVISPLLANIYLHAFDKMFQQAGISGTLVRYCDDFVILVKRKGKKVLEKVREMLNCLELELHPEKTKIVNARKGFDFLGMHFKLSPVYSEKSRLKESCRIWPSKESVARIKEKVNKLVGRRYGTSLEDMIEELNPVIRGWDNYHKIPRGGQRKPRVKLNYFVRERLRIFLKRKYSDYSRGGKRVHGGLLVRLGLYQFG
jgi:group II intron reverse transcriptase/maturase